MAETASIIHTFSRHFTNRDVDDISPVPVEKLNSFQLHIARFLALDCPGQTWNFFNDVCSFLHYWTELLPSHPGRVQGTKNQNIDKRKIQFDSRPSGIHCVVGGKFRDLCSLNFSRGSG